MNLDLGQWCRIVIFGFILLVAKTDYAAREALPDYYKISIGTLKFICQ